MKRRQVPVYAPDAIKDPAAKVAHDAKNAAEKVARRALMTPGEAEAAGYTVDRHCYPWIAYKGPRFVPDEWFDVQTPGVPQ